MTSAVWTCAVDWDDNTGFGAAGEDVSARVRSKPGYRTSRGRDQIRALSPPAVGAASFDLDNRSQDYSTEYAGVLVNLIVNPSFEVDVAGWSFDAGTLARTTVSNGQYSGVAGGLITAPVGGGTLDLYPSALLAVTAGLAYTHSAYVLDGAALRSHRCDIQWRDAALALLSTTAGSVTSPSGWSRRAVTGVAPANAVWARPIVYTLASVAGETFYHDAIQFEQSDHATDYVDGSLYNNRWAGTAHNSASIRGGGLQAAGRLVPGHRVRIQANDGTLRNIWRGFNVDFPQHPQRTEKSVSVPCLGPLSFLQGKRPVTGLYANVRTDEALGYLLDAVGWPAGDRTLDVGQTPLLYWWCDGQTDALAMAVKLLNSEGPGASLYESGDGKIVFESRHYRLRTARSTTSQATFGDAATEPKHSPDGFAYEPGLKDVIGNAAVPVNVRTATGVAVQWSLGTTLSLAPSEARVFRVVSSDPLYNAATPVAGTDYTVAAGAVTPALDQTAGAVIALTMTAGGAGATITGLQLRADKLTATQRIVRDGVAASTIQGAKDYTLDVWPELEPNRAQDLADLIVTAYKAPRPTVTIAVKNANAARLTQMLTREVSDRVTVVESQTGLAADCFVERIEHEVTEAGRFQTTRLGLEKVSAAMYPPAVVLIDGDAAHGIDSSAVIWY